MLLAVKPSLRSVICGCEEALKDLSFKFCNLESLITQTFYRSYNRTYGN